MLNASKVEPGIRIITPADPAAISIGRAYRRGLEAYVEAGRQLQAKKASLGHGAWLPWLKANEDALGFGELTAQRLMKLASENPSLTTDLLEEDDESLEIIRNLWGNNNKREDRCRNINRYNANDECFTPVPFIKDVRKVLEVIDLDPASCAEAQKRMKAKRYYDRDADALTKDWKTGRMFLNPPYSQIKRFVDKFLAELEAGRIEEAIVLSLNKTETQWGQPLGERADAICFWSRVIEFDKPKGIKPHQGGYWGHMVSYFGPNRERFAEVFARNGFIR